MEIDFITLNQITDNSANDTVINCLIENEFVFEIVSHGKTLGMKK